MGSKTTLVLAIILTIAAVGQIVLAIVLYDPQGNVAIINAGWGVLMISALFGWLPIYTLKKKGNVRGSAYIHTTTLVDSGIYGIVRHPQYLAGVLINVALPMITQHWLVAACGLVAAVVYYVDTLVEEKKNMGKFGEAYAQYMKTVPRMNFILGIWRWIRRRGSKQ